MIAWIRQGRFVFKSYDEYEKEYHLEYGQKRELNIGRQTKNKLVNFEKGIKITMIHIMHKTENSILERKKISC